MPGALYLLLSGPADAVRALGDVGETMLTGNTAKLIPTLPKTA